MELLKSGEIASVKESCDVIFIVRIHFFILVFSQAPILRHHPKILLFLSKHD